MPFSFAPRRLAIAILLYFVLLAVGYASVTPPFEAPDEGSHFLYIHNLLESGQLPALEDKDATYASKSVQRHHPPLYYLIGAALISWTQRGDVLNDYLIDNPFAAIGVVTDSNQNVFLHSPYPPAGQTLAAVWILRLYSLSLSAGTLWFVYLAGWTAFGSRKIGLLAMLLVASMPTFVFISASINNDNLVTLCYAAGVYWSLRMWRKRRIARSDIIAISLILSGAALSKLTGLTLFGVVYLAVLYGAYQRRLTWRQTWTLIGVSLAAAGILAGWWYVRNWMLYGDPLALQATLRIWSRGAPPTDLNAILYEAKGVWDSFWMVLGHFNVRGADWVYTYVSVITLAGLAGLLLVWRAGTGRQSRQETRQHLVFLLFVCGVVLAGFILSTRQINVSQGRILFPALAAFAPLMVAGWSQIFNRIAAFSKKKSPVHGYSILIILPLALITLWTPFSYLADAYRPLMVVETVPDGAHRLDAQSGTLKLLAYEVEQDTVAPGDLLRLWIYFTGSHPDNPALFVTALDPAQQPVGSLVTYPGMSPTSPLDSDTIYRAPVKIRLRNDLDSPPFRLDLEMGWLIPGANQRALPLQNASGETLKGLVVPGSTLIDAAYQPTPPQYAADVTYGNLIRLAGYTLSSSEIAAGESLTATLQWSYVQPAAGDWVVAFGLLDEANNVIVQADGMPAGYPTSAWRPSPNFDDTRVLIVPPDTPPGDYRLYVGWYRLSDGERLMPNGVGAEGSLFIAPTRIKVK